MEAQLRSLEWTGLSQTELGQESWDLLHDSGLGARELGRENSSLSPQFKGPTALEACSNVPPLRTTIPGRIHAIRV